METRKIAVIGAAGFDMATDDCRVDCYPWPQVGLIKNAKDFDTLIIDLTSADEASEENWSSFQGVLNRQTAFDLLYSRGSVVVIGDPRPAWRLLSGDNVFTDFLRWSCMKFSWDDRPGDTVSIIADDNDDGIIRYLKHLKTWNYSLRGCIIDKDALQLGITGFEAFRQHGRLLNVETEVYAVNRSREALAFSVRFVVGKVQSGPAIGEENVRKISEFGPITLLPEINLDHDHMLMAILRDVCGVDVSLPEPNWIKELKAPGQETVEQEIGDINANIEPLVARLAEAERKLADSRECLKLLYEMGPGLESVVRSTLRELGGQVEEPVDAGSEDGWVTVLAQGQELKMVIEVKSTRKDQFGEGGLRQLLDWVNRGVMSRGEKYKGVFIGNSCVEKSPQQRPKPFSKNWMRTAEISEVVALTTVDLYSLLLLKESGGLNAEEFWQNLYYANGVFDMSKYYKMLKRT